MGERKNTLVRTPDLTIKEKGEANTYNVDLFPWLKRIYRKEGLFFVNKVFNRFHESRT